MSTSPPRKHIFAVPPIIRKIFDAFPLVTYPALPLPARCPRPSTRPRLYVWITLEELKRPEGGFSFDPECLKWQTYLKFCGIPYKTVPSNNHACPSNSSALPFLIPASGDSVAPTEWNVERWESSPLAKSASPPPGYQSPVPIPAMKLAQWAKENSQRTHRIHEEGQNGSQGDDGEIDTERGDLQAFMELLDNQIRDALLYTTHLHPPNLHNHTVPKYTDSATSFIYPLISSELRASALSQLKQRHPGLIDRTAILADAALALDALSGLLGNDEWFFGGKVPGLMDAAAFGYLHVIITGEWEEEWVGG
ncbi:hypothetical protein BDZ91DRAFT_843774 [Kalaharituber pfeilii]|nr:hypothetical protein BDZ91DRAFT_843774 [Kalaharituber pfeilii]